MIWKRLKAPKNLTPEEAEARRKELDQLHLSWKDKLAMTLSAYLVLFVPAVLFLLVLCVLAMWLFRAL